MSQDDNYTNLILEEIRDQNKAVLEAVGGMQETMKTLATKDELQVVADDVQTIKQVLKATNQDVAALKQGVSDIKHRLNTVEQAA